MFTLKVENKYGEVMELTHNSAYVITSIDGIDPPQAVINTTRNASADGSVYNSAYVDNRTITITLAINESAEDNRINLYRYFKPKYPVKLYYKNEERDVYIAGYVQNMPITFFNQKQIAQITIICPDPFFVGAEEGVTEFSSVESLFEFPFNIEEAYNILPNTMESETIGGVLFTVNADKTVEAVGSSSDFVSAYVNETGISLEAGNYVLYGCAAGGSPSTYRLQAFAGSAESPTLEVNDYGAGASFELTETTTIKVRIYTNGAINELFKPMIFTRDALEYGTASGSPAHFTDGSDNALEECETEINAVQDLHGYSKPWAGGAGKNELDLASDFTLNCIGGQNKTYTIKNGVNVQGGVEYTISCKQTTALTSATRFSLVIMNINSTTLYEADITNPTLTPHTHKITFTPTSDQTINFNFWSNTPSDDIVLSDFMLEVGSQATDFEPYSNICPISGHTEVTVTVASTSGGSGEDTTVNLGRTVYGGTLDVTTGVLTVDKGFKTYTGDASENWFYTSSLNRVYINIADAFRPTSSIPILSNMLWDSQGEREDYGAYINDQANLVIYVPSTITSASDWKTWLTSNNIDMEIEYELATPQTYQLTKAQVRSIVGENYIDSDTGEIEVKYIVYTDIDRNYQKYGSGGGVEFSVIIINRETNVYNGGDVETGAVITLQIEGVVKDPKIYNVETNDYFILDDLTLQDGDVVTINTVKKQKSVTLLRDGAVTNLIGKVRFGSTWFQLFPLDNTFIATAELYPENMLVTFTISNLFEGV